MQMGVGMGKAMMARRMNCSKFVYHTICLSSRVVVVLGEKLHVMSMEIQDVPASNKNKFNDMQHISRLL